LKRDSEEGSVLAESGKGVFAGIFPYEAKRER